MMRGVVLNRYRQGETSCILRIFTDELGLIGVYVRGGMKKKEIPEIGDYLEGAPSRRSSEGMYSLYQFSILEKYAFYTSLEIHAFRDIIFELLWKTLPEEDPQIELFDVVLLCLHYFLKDEKELFKGYFYLWLFLYRYTQILGFNLDLSHCSKCGTVVNALGVSLQNGMVECTKCNKGVMAIPSSLNMLLSGKASPNIVSKFTARERVTITRILLMYVEYHVAFHGKINGFEFLKEIELGTVDS